jgi:hypothetical protein
MLLEASSLLHSQLPLDSVLAKMLDHAVAVLDADRGLLLENGADGALKVRLAGATAASDCRQKALHRARRRFSWH